MTWKTGWERMRSAAGMEVRPPRRLERFIRLLLLADDGVEERRRTRTNALIIYDAPIVFTVLIRFDSVVFAAPCTSAQEVRLTGLC